MLITPKLAIIGNTRLHKISSNGTRIMFKYGTKIIKVDSENTPYGNLYNQCRNEVKLYKKLDKCDKKYFCRPIKHGRKWVIQDIIKFKKGRRPKWAFDLVESLFFKYKLHDFHEENWGIKENGQPIIFDYGV